jgi:hypothetical protein
MLSSPYVEINDDNNQLANSSDANVPDAIKKSLKVWKQLEPTNIPIKLINKINKIDNLVSEYENNLGITNSHIESTLITTSKTISEGSIQATSIVVGSEIGLEIAAGGGFTPVSCFLGAGVAAGISIIGIDSSKQIGIGVKKLSGNIISGVKTFSKSLPKYAQDLIYECVSEPVEKVLTSVYNLSRESINGIKNTITNVLADGWEKLLPQSTIIYCEDFNSNKIEIQLDKSIGTKIYNYCHGVDFYECNCGQEIYFNNRCWDLTCPNKPTKFSLKYDEFESDLNLLKSILSKFNFVSTKLTPYEQIYKPRTNILTRTKINSNTIPDYKVICNVSRGDSGGIGGILGTCVVIAIQVSWAF